MVYFTGFQYNSVVYGITQWFMVYLIDLLSGIQTCTRFWDRKREINLHQTPISDRAEHFPRQSDIYYELPDTLLETGNDPCFDQIPGVLKTKQHALIMSCLLIFFIGMHASETSNKHIFDR